VQDGVTPKDLSSFADLWNQSFSMADREESNKHGIQAIKSADGAVIYGKPNWLDQQPRDISHSFPTITPHWWDIQIALHGVGEWNYADFIRHHIAAMTKYLINEGHGNPDLGERVVTPDSFNCHFKRSPDSQTVDLWILVKSPTPYHARLMFYLLWERSVSTNDGRMKKFMVHNTTLEREIRGSVNTVLALANMGQGTHTPEHFTALFPAIEDVVQEDEEMHQGPLGLTTPLDEQHATNPTPSQAAPRPGTEGVAPSAGAAAAHHDADVAMTEGLVTEEAEMVNIGGRADTFDI
jgi:hypothetical protein